MKKLTTINGYIQLEDTKEEIKQGYQFGELMYKIKGNSISFFYQEDYLYDNNLYTAHIPKFEIDGVIYDKNNIGDALNVIFRGTGSIDYSIEFEKINEELDELKQRIIDLENA